MTTSWCIAVSFVTIQVHAINLLPRRVDESNGFDATITAEWIRRTLRRWDGSFDANHVESGAERYDQISTF